MRNDYTRMLIYIKITVCGSDCKFHTGQESMEGDQGHLFPGIILYPIIIL